MYKIPHSPLLAILAHSLILSFLLVCWVEVLLQRHAKLFPQGFELLQILVVLSLVLNLGLDSYILVLVTVTSADGTRESGVCVKWDGDWMASEL